MYLRIAELLDVPLRKYEDAVQRVTELGEQLRAVIAAARRPLVGISKSLE